jgi:hypothetical protein
MNKVQRPSNRKCNIKIQNRLWQQYVACSKEMCLQGNTVFVLCLRDKIIYIYRVLYRALLSLTRQEELLGGTAVKNTTCWIDVIFPND